MYGQPSIESLHSTPNKPFIRPDRPSTAKVRGQRESNEYDLNQPTSWNVISGRTQPDFPQEYSISPSKTSSKGSLSFQEWVFKKDQEKFKK